VPSRHINYQGHLPNNPLPTIESPQSTEATLHNPGRMEYHTLNPRRARQLAERRALSDSPRRGAPTQNPRGATRCTYHRASWPRQDFHSSLSSILVAWDADLGYELHCRMHSVPTEQERHPLQMHAVVLHPHTRQCASIPTDSPGPYYWTAAQWTA